MAQDTDAFGADSNAKIAPPSAPFRWDGDLDHRRRRARELAMGLTLIGVTVQAVYAATLAFVFLFAAARFSTYWQSQRLSDSPLWRFGLFGAVGFAVGAFILTFLFTIRGAIRGGAKWLLAGLPIREGKDDELHQVRNVVEELAIGLGVAPPNLMVIEEPTPNTISGQSGRVCTLCVTTGLISLPRPEIEAICAHEIAALHAPDAKLVSAAFMALIRARNVSRWIEWTGILIAVGAIAALKIGAFLPSVFGVGVALAFVSWAALSLLRAPLYSLRSAVMDLADVAAVYLVRNPVALADVLNRLAADKRRVATTTDRCEFLWFEPVEQVQKAAGADDDTAEDRKRKEAAFERSLADADERSRKELERRAALVSATAQGIRTR